MKFKVDEPSESIPRLRAGMVVRLPSGSIIRLMTHDQGEWVCEHLRESVSSGITVYRSLFLRRYGVER